MSGVGQHYGATDPADYLLTDLFNLPVVEPYAISEPLSTSGRINMNYQSKKPKKGKGRGAGIIAFGVTFALFSVVFHANSLGRLLLGLILSGLIGSITVRTEHVSRKSRPAG